MVKRLPANLQKTDWNVTPALKESCYFGHQIAVPMVCNLQRKLTVDGIFSDLLD